MSNVRMAICFLDEEDKVVAKKDLEVTWDLNVEQDMGMLHEMLIMDEVAAILTYQTKLDLDRGVIRELLDEVKKINKGKE